MGAGRATGCTDRSAHASRLSLLTLTLVKQPAPASATQTTEQVRSSAVQPVLNETINVASDERVTYSPTYPLTYALYLTYALTLTSVDHRRLARQVVYGFIWNELHNGV